MPGPALDVLLNNAGVPMAGHELSNEKGFAGLLLLLAAFLVTLGVTIFPHRETPPAPTAVTGGSREVPAPGNPPTPVAPQTPAPAPQGK